MSFSNSQENTDNNALRELRDTIKELTEETKVSNKNTSKLNKGIFLLTSISTIIVAIEFFTKIVPLFCHLFVS